jgi:benzylsuccinate CoA-transferase BbsF subunit
MSQAPFAGVKVIDLTWSGAGVFIINFLSHYGATVIRVESARQPDPIRHALTYTNAKSDDPHILELGAYFAFSHPAQKYGMTLDLKNPRALEVFKKLVAWADVVGECFPTGVIERLGLGYEELRKVKRDIIMFRSCGFGHTGPMANQPGFGMTLAAYAMMYSQAGWPERRPVPVSSYYSDQLSPLFGMLALVTALDFHRRTGKGQVVDQSQIESSLHYLSPVLLDYAVNRRNLALRGNKCAYAAPHGVYRCQGADRWVAIAVTDDREWEDFGRAINSPEWTREERFKTLLGRVKHSDELDQYVESWTLNHTAEEVTRLLQSAGVGAGVAANAQDIVEDVQLKHYHYFREVDHPYSGRLTYCHPPAMKLSEAEASIGRSTILGEHNEYVCKEVLGYSQEGYLRLVQEKVFD